MEARLVREGSMLPAVGRIACSMFVRPLRIITDAGQEQTPPGRLRSPGLTSGALLHWARSAPVQQEAGFRADAFSARNWNQSGGTWGPSP